MFQNSKLVTLAGLLLTLVALEGCGTGVVKTIAPTPGAPLALNATASFDVTGVGKCAQMSVDFGDGSAAVDVTNVGLDTTTTYTHIYKGWWGGGRIVRATGVTDCAGKVETHVKLTPEARQIGLVPRPGVVCSAIPNATPLRKNTLVHARAITGTAVNEIDFGCPFHGCHYDLRGDSAAAPANYPFEGLRKDSMVFRVRNQVVQGPTTLTDEMSFTTLLAGPLEICVNENSLDHATGGWGVIVRIDDLAK